MCDIAMIIILSLQSVLTNQPGSFFRFFLVYDSNFNKKGKTDILLRKPGVIQDNPKFVYKKKACIRELQRNQLLHLIIVSIILYFSLAKSACGTSAGSSIISPDFTMFDTSPIVISAFPSII